MKLIFEKLAKIKDTNARLVALSILTGIIAGLGAIAFYTILEWTKVIILEGYGNIYVPNPPGDNIVSPDTKQAIKESLPLAGHNLPKTVVRHIHFCRSW